MSLMTAWVLFFLVVGMVSLAWGIYYTYVRRKAKQDRMFHEAIWASKRSFRNNRPPTKRKW